MYVTGDCTTKLSNCFSVSNDAKYGGGIYLAQSTRSEISNCTYFDNTADFGAGIFAASMFYFINFASIMIIMSLASENI